MGPSHRIDRAVDANPAKGRGVQREPDRSARAVNVRWAALVLLAPLVCFLLASFYTNRWSARIEGATRTISEHTRPAIVELAGVRDDICKIEHLAQQVTPASVAEDRAEIAALEDEIERAQAAYRATANFPAEREPYEAMKRERARFFAVVGTVLAAVENGQPASREAIDEVRPAAIALSASAGNLVRINASEASAAGATIAGLRRRTHALSNARDALAFAFVIVGTALGLRATRQQALLAEERRRRDQERIAELDAFTGRVAHDLRGLLSSILLRASLGERAGTLQEATQALARVTNQSQRMGLIIDALLSFARAAGRPDPAARCEATEVLVEIVADARHRADEAGATIVVEPAQPALVRCSASVLSVILANLVGNALKYGSAVSEREPRVTLRCRSEDARVRFEVEDTGPGLPPGTEERVFEPFVQLEANRRGSEGVGLGLATARRLVEAHGGEIGVTSRPGLGCCFWFILPAA
jgi:signal transduction histidine kinase